MPAGLLEDLNTQAPTFACGRRYLARPNAIEVDPVALPLAKAEGGVKRFTLPGHTEFGGLRDAAPDAWGRRVIENKLRVGSGTLPEVAYLLEAGVDRVGALDVRKDIAAPAKPSAAGEVGLARLLEAADRIENDEPLGDDLAHCFDGLGSASGARPKASVRDAAGVLWLAKFPSKSDRACNAVLDMGIDEYDARNSSYQALAQQMRARAVPTFIERDLRELFKRQALNIFANNNDDHLRNHAFIYDMAARGWKAHFERFNASARDMLHLEGAFRRLAAFTSPELVKALRSFEG